MKTHRSRDGNEAAPVGFYYPIPRVRKIFCHHPHPCTRGKISPRPVPTWVRSTRWVPIPENYQQQQCYTEDRKQQEAYQCYTPSGFILIDILDNDTVYKI